jgi:hypothetical protein
LSPVYGDPEEPDRLNQGDLFVGVPFIGFDSRDPARMMPSLGVITANSCDCDKFFSAREKGISEDVEATWPIIVAPAHSPEQLVGGQAGHARRGEMPRYFHLPAEGEMEELVIDLGREQALPAVTLLERERIASLSEETRLKLYIHLWVLRTRLKPEDVFKSDLAG